MSAAQKKKHYFGVAFAASGAAVTIGPFGSESEVREALAEGIRKHPQKYVATTYNVSEDATMFEKFGHPASRDLYQDKKFMKEITL